MAVVIPMTVLVIFFISCRFYSRTVLIRTLGWDDWTMFVAAVSLAGGNEDEGVLSSAGTVCWK